MRPTSVQLRLPVEDSDSGCSCAITNIAVLASSAKVVQVFHDTTLLGGSRVAFATLLHLGKQFPHTRQLRLQSIVLEHDATLTTPVSPLPLFAHLETLIIKPGSNTLAASTSMTQALFALLPHMPVLRCLSMYVPILRPHVVPRETATHLPALPPAFSLSTFVCTGRLPVPAWARLIAHSHRTLAELRIVVVVVHLDPSAAELVEAIALAAPRVERLDLRLLIDERVLLPRMRPIFAALARLRTLSLEMPHGAALADAFELLAHAPAGIPLRTLAIRSPPSVERPSEDIPRVMQLAECAQLRRLVSVRLFGFEIGDEGRRALTEHWRARRVRFDYVT